MTSVTSRPKLALLIHSLFGGGAERLMSELASRWSERYEVHLITWAASHTDTYTVPTSVVRHGLNLQTPSRNRLSGLLANRRRVRTLRRTLGEIQPDLQLSFSDQMNIASLSSARAFSFPKIIAEHSDPSRQKLGTLWEIWRNRVYPTCDHCVVLTDEIRNHFRRWLPTDRISVIPPAIRDFEPHETADPIAGSDNSPKTILFVGRLSPEKRLDVLIDAWRQLEADLPHWQLRIVGDGAEREALQQQAKGLRAVIFEGWTQSPERYFRAAHLFVLPSAYEGFPVALLEAMRWGVPSITTNCSSAIEQLNRTAACIATVAVGSVEQLRDSIRRFAHDPPLREEQGAAARQRALDFQWSRIGPRWDELIEAHLR